MKDKWLDDIKDRVSDFEMETPDGLWDSIEKEMAVVASETLTNPKTEKPLLLVNWKKFVTIAAAIALIIGVCLTLFFDNEDDVPILAEISEATLGSSVNIGKELPSGDISKDSESILAKVSENVEKKPSSSVKNNVQDDDISKEISTYNSEASDLTAINSEKDKSPVIILNNPIVTEHNFDKNGEVLPIQNDLMAYGDVSVGAFTSASGIVGSIPAGHGNNLNFGNGSSLDYGSSNGPDTRMGGLKLDGFELPSVPSYMVFEHKLPVKVGMDVSWHINRLLALQAGLSYTYLKSDIRYGATYSYGKATQQLHYVGVPVSIRYIPFQWKNISAYVSAGVMLEKCVAGKISSDSPFGVRFAYDGMNERPFQFSANAALGIQYDITKICGVFVEPGLSYYLDDGTSLRTIYKEHPVNFNLNIGLRFSLPKTK